MQLTGWHWRRCLALLALVAAPACNRAAPPPATRTSDSARAPDPPVADGARNAGFRTAALLDEHFRKHGREFGDISQAEYLRRARLLRDARPGGEVLELVRGDGSVSRFDRTSGAFLAFDADGTIRTFFRPNDGEAYFRRQARRRARGP